MWVDPPARKGEHHTSKDHEAWKGQLLSTAGGFELGRGWVTLAVRSTQGGGTLKKEGRLRGNTKSLLPETVSVFRQIPKREKKSSVDKSESQQRSESPKRWGFIMYFTSFPWPVLTGGRGSGIGEEYARMGKISKKKIVESKVP